MKVYDFQLYTFGNKGFVVVHNPLSSKVTKVTLTQKYCSYILFIHWIYQKKKLSFNTVLEPQLSKSQALKTTVTHQQQPWPLEAGWPPGRPGLASRPPAPSAPPSEPRQHKHSPAPQHYGPPYQPPQARPHSTGGPPVPPVRLWDISWLVGVNSSGLCLAQAFILLTVPSLIMMIKFHLRNSTLP